MAVTTIHAHVNRALDFYSKTSIYFAIGRTSAWANESEPPNEDTNASALDQVIGYKKVENCYMVRPYDADTDASFDVEYRDERWVFVDPSQAIANGARWVYIDTTIRYDELPLGFYRQVGVYTGLTKKSSVSASKYNLIPSEVESAGVLEVIDNREPSNRQIDQKEKLSLVIEF